MTHDPTYDGPVKAYRNIDFLTGPDARSIRILCEYLEPLHRLRSEQASRAIIFFGSARTRKTETPRSDDYAPARGLARRLAQWTVDKHEKSQRFHICTGGGPGIMEAAHEGSASVDASLNIGLNISLPFEQHANPHVAKNLAFEFHYFFMRKLWFANLAHGIVVFPGGFGTMEELFEILTLMQTHKLQRLPVVLYGRDFWQRLLNFEVLVEGGLISPEDLDLFLVSDSLDEAYAHLTERVEAVVRDP